MRTRDAVDQRSGRPMREKKAWRHGLFPRTSTLRTHAKALRFENYGERHTICIHNEFLCMVDRVLVCACFLYYLLQAFRAYTQTNSTYVRAAALVNISNLLNHREVEREARWLPKEFAAKTHIALCCAHLVSRLKHYNIIF
jgi:hypothetical protein